MNDFEEKYSLLVKYMLPSVNKCIKSVEFDGFVSGRESMGVRNPKDDYEKRMNDRFAEYLTPKIKVTLVDSCKGMRGMGTMGLKGDIAGRLSDLNHVYFEDKKLNANTNFIYVI